MSELEKSGRPPSAWPPLSALALDPIEKKPLARFYPGALILSVGFFGCSFHCPFCQNSDISQLAEQFATGSGILSDHNSIKNYNDTSREEDCPAAASAAAARPERAGMIVSPEELVRQAVAVHSRGNIGIAYTYSEPLVHLPFVRQTATLARAAGLKNVLVSNGFASEATARGLFPLLDAANIDLKAFGAAGTGFYNWIGAPGGLEVVQHSIALAAAEPELHLEVTTLIIPGRNDNSEDMDAEARWLASLDPTIPLHITRFHPAYQLLDITPTPRETIHGLVRIARQHLRHVYPGNL